MRLHVELFHWHEFKQKGHVIDRLNQPESCGTDKLIFRSCPCFFSGIKLCILAPRTDGSSVGEESISTSGLSALRSCNLPPYGSIGAIRIGNGAGGFKMPFSWKLVFSEI